MYTDTVNTLGLYELFTWWSGLETSATAGTTLADWDAVPYRDAWCFSRRERTDSEAYLIRGTSLVNFGWEDDDLESAYQMLSRSSRPSSTDTRAVRRRV